MKKKLRYEKSCLLTTKTTITLQQIIQFITLKTATYNCQLGVETLSKKSSLQIGLHNQQLVRINQVLLPC